MLEYLNTGDDHVSIDFWTCKNYDLKELSDVTRLVYDDLLHRFSGTSIPIFLSEYGNKSKKFRLLHETTALYSSLMSHIFSGGCVYEFWQNANGYGLVEMLKHQGDKQTTHTESTIYERQETDRGTLLILRDFVNYKARLAENNGRLVRKLPDCGRLIFTCQKAVLTGFHQGNLWKDKIYIVI